jgi:aspartate aminotransferase
LDEDDGSVEKMRQEFSKRREFMFKGLTAIEGVTCLKPEGAFYIMANVDSYLQENKKGINTTQDLCKYILQNYHVALVAGSAFGVEGYVRFSYANSLENIRKGIAQFEQGLKSLQH